MSNVPKEAIDLIKKFEKCHLKAYLCTSGLWKIGYGSTRGVHPDLEITQEQAESRLRQDAAAAAKDVDRLVKVPLNVNQRAALIDFVFDLGSQRLERSTLLGYLNHGNYGSVPQELQKWVYGATRIGTVKLDTMVKRRHAEGIRWNLPV